jgi:hypothetical protein
MVHDKQASKDRLTISFGLEHPLAFLLDQGSQLPAQQAPAILAVMGTSTAQNPQLFHNRSCCDSAGMVLQQLV